MSDAVTQFEQALAAEEAARWAPLVEPPEAPPVAPEPAAEPAPPEPQDAAPAPQDAAPEPQDAPAETAEPEAPDARSDEDEMSDRIKRAHIESREAKRRARLLEQELEVLKGTRTEPRDETIKREAETLAQQIAVNEAWNRECNRIAQAGFKAYPDFQKTLDEFKASFPEWNGVPGSISEAAMEAAPGSEHEIIHWLGNNLDEAERIARLPPAKQGAAVARIADKLKAPKPMSKAPPPIRPAQGSNATSAAPTKDPDKMSTAEFMKWQDEQDRKRRVALYGG
jgi:hypothetical protein